MRALTEMLKKVTLMLYYLSDEAQLRMTANTLSMSRQAVSVVVRHTCIAIAIHLGPKYIKSEAEDLVLGFHCAHSKPQRLGVVYSTHNEIKAACD